MVFKVKLFKGILGLALFLIGSISSAESEFFLNPLNIAEALIMPQKPEKYSYYYRYSFKKSQIKSDKNSKLSNYYGAYLTLRGSGKKPGGSIELKTNLSCNDYDQLVLYIRMISGCMSFELTADTDKGTLKTTCTKVRGYKKTKEVVLKLKGAAKLNNVKIKLIGETRNSAIKLAFLALRDSQRYEAVKKMLERRMEDLHIERFLKPENYKASGKLTYNLFLTPAEAEKYRKQILGNPAARKQLKAEADYLKSLPAPELLYDQCTTLHCESRRETTFQKYKKYNITKYPLYYFRSKGRQAALAGFLLKDAELLRLAARYCLTVVLADAWGDDGYMGLLADFDSGGLAFSESDTVRDIAFMADFAGEMFDLSGIQLVHSKVAVKGLGQLNYSAWTRGGHQHGNQMCHFSMGRIAGYMMLEKGPRSMSNVKEYTDLAMKDIDRVCKIYFKPDGGCIESTFYVAHTMGWMMEPYLMYATARGKKVPEVIPNAAKKSGAFAQIVLSTRRNPQCCIIPIGLCSSCKVRATEIPALAVVAPQSAWINIFNRFRFPNGKLGLEGLKIYYRKDPVAWKFGQIIEKARAVKVENFTLLRSCELVQSTRSYKNQTVKIVFESLADKMGKRQNEVGSFVLEFAGDAFAMAIPSFNNLFYGHAQWHNMLVPMQGGKFKNSIKPRNLYSKKTDFKSMQMTAAGDSQKFSASANLTESWDQSAFKHWDRKIDSPTPNEIIITDNYQLGSGADAVSFCWQTYLPVKQKGNIVEIFGRDGTAQLTVPEGCTVAIDEVKNTIIAKALGLKAKHQYSRIRFVKKGKSGTITVKVKLTVKKK